MKIQIFNDSHIDDLQEAVNKWLSEHPNISISDILQSESEGDSPWGLTITILYIE